MTTHKLTIRITMLVLVLLLGGLTSVYAQGPDEDDTAVVVAPSGRLNLSLRQLGYDTKRMTRDNSTRHYRVNLPGNFQILPTGNYFDLITYHQPAVPDKPSLIRSFFNGQPSGSFLVTENNAISSTIRTTLPFGVLHNGANSIRINLDTSNTCEDPGALLDLFIDRESIISFGYVQNPYPTDLSLYPFPFTEQSLLSIPTTIVLPDNPSLEDLTAASTVAAGLGRLSNGVITLSIVEVGDLSNDIRNNHHLILIGKPDDNTVLGSLDLPLSIDNVALDAGQGVLQEIVSPWNEFRLILVVSGLDDAGLSKASNALNREAHFLGMRGSVAVVTEIAPVSESVTSRSTTLTLASLGYEDQVVYGIAPQDFIYRFDLPLGWQLERPPFFVLKFAHSDILDPHNSAMDIRLNGVPIGSTLLDESNADDGEITVSLPSRLFQTGRNTLSVALEMNFVNPDLNRCRHLNDERAWTVISSESEIVLPYNSSELRPDLDYFPYPFSKNSGFERTLLVLPDHPSPRIYKDMIQLAVRMGSVSRTEILSPQVAFASGIDAATSSSYHMILLGLPSENALLREINSSLPQPFATDGNILESLAVDNVSFLSDPERDTGLLQIISSPWNTRNSLLAITGTTDEGSRLAMSTLLEQSSKLKGNLAVIEPVIDPLSGDVSRVSTYTIDTRPLAPFSTQGLADSIGSETSMILLAERWWK